MVETLSITLGFAALFVTMQVVMSVIVGVHRARTGIRFMDGGDAEMMRRMRAHGNFAENVPSALIVMAGAEALGTASVLVLGGGVILVLARLIHYAAIRQTVPNVGRAIGAGATSLTILFFAGAIVAGLWGMI